MNNFYYLNGLTGMKSDGTFTTEKRHWMPFSEIDASRMNKANIKPNGATHRGIFVDTVTGDKLSTKNPHVTPQVPERDMESYIKVAANSIQELRKVDVYRVLVESNRIEHRLAIAEYIKAARPDLAEEVADILAEEGNGTPSPHA